MRQTQVSSHPDSDLIPTQPIKDMAAGVDAGTTVQNTEHEMRLCEKKRLQIQEFLRSQNLGLAGITNNQDNGMVKCQCGWDGEEPAMVSPIRSRCIQLASNAKKVRLLVRFARRASTCFAMALQALMIQDFRRPMLVISAYLNQMKHSCFVNFIRSFS